MGKPPTYNQFIATQKLFQFPNYPVSIPKKKIQGQIVLDHPLNAEQLNHSSK